MDTPQFDPELLYHRKKSKSRSNWEHKLSQSAEAFESIVWPAVCLHPDIGGGELIPVESVTQKRFTQQLDIYGGIDAWQLIQPGGIRGIASRVQWGADRQTFSIRYQTASGNETEYAKRLRALNDTDAGYLTPHFTVQAYIGKENNELQSVAVITTRHLIEQAERLFSWGKLNDDSDRRYGMKTMNDGTQFIYLLWDYLTYSDVSDHIILFD
jgi:hypothetical protein